MKIKKVKEQPNELTEAIANFRTWYIANKSIQSQINKSHLKSKIMTTQITKKTNHFKLTNYEKGI